MGEASHPGPPPTSPKASLRLLSWSLGSWDKRGQFLLELAAEQRADVIFLQEHGIRTGRSLTAELRRQGWQAFWGPVRRFGAGEAVLVHRRYAATQLTQNNLSPVFLSLKNGTHLRLVCTYAPSGNDAARVEARQQYFHELESWSTEPGACWLAGGDFNHDLSESIPFPAVWKVPPQGTFRRSVQGPWLRPIDGFTVSPVLQRGLQLQLFPCVSDAQHCPILCDVKAPSVSASFGIDLSLLAPRLGLRARFRSLRPCLRLVPSLRLGICGPGSPWVSLPSVVPP